MVSSVLINLIVSIVAVGILVAVLRAAHLVAGGRLEEQCAKERPAVDSPYEFERAA